MMLYFTFILSLIMFVVCLVLYAGSKQLLKQGPTQEEINKLVDGCYSYEQREIDLQKGLPVDERVRRLGEKAPDVYMKMYASLSMWSAIGFCFFGVVLLSSGLTLLLF